MATPVSGNLPEWRRQSDLNEEPLEMSPDFPTHSPFLHLFFLTFCFILLAFRLLLQSTTVSGVAV